PCCRSTALWCAAAPTKHACHTTESVCRMPISSASTTVASDRTCSTASRSPRPRPPSSSGASQVPASPTHSRASAPTWPRRSAPDHDTAYDELRESLSRLEKELAVDRLQLVARDGRQLYANEVSEAQWVSEPRAVYVLDDFRERKLTARELADSALRWQVLVQRLSADPAVPSEVTDQAVGWREEATAKAESDPDAKQLLAWGREAEAF